MKLSVWTEALDCLWSPLNKKAHGITPRAFCLLVVVTSIVQISVHLKSKNASNLCICYYSISLPLFCFSCSFIKTNTLTHSQINAFFYFISRCKDTNFFDGYFVLFMSSFKYAQYSSNDLVIVSFGINRRRYSATIVGLNERLNVYSTDTRSAEGHRMMPMVGFS